MELELGDVQTTALIPLAIKANDLWATFAWGA